MTSRLPARRSAGCWNWPTSSTGPLVVVGQILDGLPPLSDRVTVVSLVERFGRERAIDETLACVREVVEEHLADFGR